MPPCPDGIYCRPHQFHILLVVGGCGRIHVERSALQSRRVGGCISESRMQRSIKGQHDAVMVPLLTQCEAQVQHLQACSPRSRKAPESCSYDRSEQKGSADSGLCISYVKPKTLFIVRIDPRIAALIQMRAIDELQVVVSGEYSRKE